MSPPTSHPWERRGYSGEPLACEIDYKNTATQEPCGCISGTRQGVQSIHYCPLHAQAPALLEFVKFAITEEGATCYQHPSKPAFFIKRLDAITEQARALLAQIEGGRP